MPDFPPVAFTEAHGLPRPDWKVIYQQIEKGWSREKKHAFSCAAQQEWLERLRAAMAEAYAILESDHHFILTAYRGMAYELSEQLVTAMIKPDRVTFNAFLREANTEDGGEGACRTYFGVGLGVWAQEVLGEGVWDPKPPEGSKGAL